MWRIADFGSLTTPAGFDFTLNTSGFENMDGDPADDAFFDVVAVFDDKDGMGLGSGSLFVSFAPPAAVPEPGSVLLIGLAAACGGLGARRRRRAARG